MNKQNIKTLRSASKILHKEFDKTKCKERDAFCFQCLTDRVIYDFDNIIDLVDESKWKPAFKKK